MDKKQQELILELAKKLKQEKKSQSQSIKLLESVGIIPLKGQSNKHYPNLERVMNPA